MPAEVAAIVTFEPLTTATLPDASATTATPGDPAAPTYGLPVRHSGCPLGQRHALSLDLCCQRVGSSANFVSADLMHRLLSDATPHPTLWVLMANGDRVPCQGMARDVPLKIGSKDFNITCFGIDLGAFGLILGF